MQMKSEIYFAIKTTNGSKFEIIQLYIACVAAEVELKKICETMNIWK